MDKVNEATKNDEARRRNAESLERIGKLLENNKEAADRFIQAVNKIPSGSKSILSLIGGLNGVANSLGNDTTKLEEFLKVLDRIDDQGNYVVPKANKEDSTAKKEKKSQQKQTQSQSTA